MPSLHNRGTGYRRLNAYPNLVRSGDYHARVNVRLCSSPADSPAQRSQGTQLWTTRGITNDAFSTHRITASPSRLAQLTFARLLVSSLDRKLLSSYLSNDEFQVSWSAISDVRIVRLKNYKLLLLVIFFERWNNIGRWPRTLSTRELQSYTCYCLCAEPLGRNCMVINRPPSLVRLPPRR